MKVLLGLWLSLAFVGGFATEIKLPTVALQGVPVQIEVQGGAPSATLNLEFLDSTGTPRLTKQETLSSEGMLSTEIRLSQTGVHHYRWRIGEHKGEGSLRVIPAWWSLVPPIVAVMLALLLRQVVLALVAGIWIGAWMVFGGDPFSALLRVVDTYLLSAYADRDHLQIIGFTLLIGGMIGIITRAGGLQALIRLFSKWANTPRRAQLMTYLMGWLVFFDDYANSMLVGSTMRPITDRLRIAREKLAFLVDATSAPVANLALIGTWIGFEVSLIADSFKASGVQMEPYWAFIASLPYRFYPILMLVFIPVLIWLGRDFGAMYRAEVRARTQGKVLADDASPLADYESAELQPRTEGHIGSALLPILATVVATLVSMVYTGYHALGEGEPATLRTVLSNADSFKSLLWGSTVGCGVAVLTVLATRTLSLRATFDAWLGGLRMMLLAVVILGLAWSIGQVCEELHTANYLVQALQGSFAPAWLPALTTLVAAGISFATGSSWATMSILMPLTIPLAVNLTVGMPAEQQSFFLIASLSSVLAGATFGDHCSPISDTTVLSSIFTGSDHIDHVRTQLPYALVVGAIAWVIGDIGTAHGLPVWLALLLGVLSVSLIARVFGKPLPCPPNEGQG